MGIVNEKGELDVSDDRFDVIIVGGGLAGTTAAYVLARAGKAVLLIEKGNYSGSKNMTGGRLYGHSLEAVIPGFAERMPIERRVSRERLTLTRGEVRETVEFASDGVRWPEGPSYIVQRAKCDRWLADLAEEEGAMCVTGIRVDDLLVREGVVCGVVAGDEEMEADVVLLADGVNSLLSQKLGLKEELRPEQVTVGVKEVIELARETLERRFGIGPDGGVAWMLPGCRVAGAEVDGFLYTNLDSVSVGLTMPAAAVDRTEETLPQLLEDFKGLPDIAPLLEGGKLLEYSAHLIPEGGVGMIPRLYGDGVLLAGDAAAFSANLGFTLRGMDLAVESGKLAAEAILAAGERGDFSAASLSEYRTAVESSFICTCVRGAEACREALADPALTGDPLAVLSGCMNRAFA